MRVASATSGLSLRMRETVATDTPLAAAISMIVVLGTFDRAATVYAVLSGPLDRGEQSATLSSVPIMIPERASWPGAATLLSDVNPR